MIANVDARPHVGEPEHWRKLMIRQLVAQVRWSGSMRTLATMAHGGLRLVELGPGTVLTGLARRGAGQRAGRAAPPPPPLPKVGA